MENKNRRKFNSLLAKSVALVPAASLLSHNSYADDVVMIDPETGMGKQLKYVEVTPDPEKNCEGCVHYTAQEGKEYGACTLLPGGFVTANGWCSVFAPKPS
jgi:hypothetical protein